MFKPSSNSQVAMIETSSDIEIVDEENRSLVKINNVAGNWNDITPSEVDDELNSKNISQFNHWFSSLPVAAVTAAGNSSRLMICSFEFSQLVQAKDGSGAIGAVLKPGTNKIGAQARFQEASNLKSMVNVNLAFNIASQILAQKHLADINERLQIIEKKVDAIHKHLEASRFARIQALQEHLSTIATLLSAGKEITKDTLQNLAKSAQEVRAQVIHINKDIAAAYDEITLFDPHALFGSDGLRDKLKQQINKVERLQREYLVGMQCLLMTNLVLFIKHSGNKEFVLTGEKYLKELNDANEIIPQWEKIKRTIALHMSKMKPLFERATSSQANVLQVESRLKQADNHLCIDTTQIMQLSDRIQAAQSPKVMLEIVNGKVQRGRYLS